MMRKSLLGPAALALLLGTSHMSHAQGFAAGGGPGGPMMGAMAQGSNPMGLLQRPEVQNELHLDLKQKNALAELQNTQRADAGQRIGQALQGVDFGSLRGMSPEQRQAKLQELQPQIQAQIQSIQGELDEKVKKILKPEQIARLHELDLQKRGPFALADAKVAEEVKLSAEHRGAINRIAAEHATESGNTMREAFQKMMESGQLQRGQRPDFNNKLNPTRQKMDKLKKEAEEKILATLSPEEKTAWEKAQGELFHFRADAPITAPRRGNVGGRGAFGGATGAFGRGGQ